MVTNVPVGAGAVAALEYKDQQATVASVRSAQACDSPTATAVNVPAGNVDVREPATLSQQTRFCRGVIPHALNVPTLMLVKLPEGVSPSRPQQATVPSACSPQAYDCPIPTSTKAPDGESLMPSPLPPQQIKSPVGSIAQAFHLPAVMDVKRPAGGASAAPLLQPQQAIEPSLLRNAQANCSPTLTCVAVPV
jgi:hypothetical protein